MSTSTPGRVATPQPRARPAAAWLGLVLALLLVALAVAAGQDALARWGVTGVGASWIGAVLDGVDGLRAAAWTVPTGIALVVVGIALLGVALKPRRRTHVQVEANADLWVTPAALGALARDAAEEVPGVAQVAVQTSRGSVRVRVGTDRPDEVSGPVQEAVRTRLDGASTKVQVTTHRPRRERREGADL